MNQLGTVVALGNPGYDEGDMNDIGSVLMMEYDSVLFRWMPLGSNNVTGRLQGEECGDAVDLNADGTVVAIGCRTSEEDQRIGRVLMFQYDRLADIWSPVGQSLEATVPFGRFGARVRPICFGYYPGGGVIRSIYSRHRPSLSIRCGTKQVDPVGSRVEWGDW